MQSIKFKFIKNSCVEIVNNLSQVLTSKRYKANFISTYNYFKHFWQIEKSILF